MGHFSSLAESTSPIANELHTLIRIHPAFSYIRTSHLYDQMYEHFKAKSENLSEARVRTVLHIFHILDEIAHSLGLIASDLHYSIPEHIFTDAIQNPKYKAGSHMVTHESRLRQQQRARKASHSVESSEVRPDMTTDETTADVVAAINDPFNQLMSSFINNKFPKTGE